MTRWSHSHRVQSPFWKLTDPACCRRSHLGRREDQPQEGGSLVPARGRSLRSEGKRESRRKTDRQTRTETEQRRESESEIVCVWDGQTDVDRLLLNPPPPPHLYHSPGFLLYPRPGYTSSLYSRPAFCSCPSGLSLILFLMP